jgi:hypothetical protein
VPHISILRWVHRACSATAPAHSGLTTDSPNRYRPRRTKINFPYHPRKQPKINVSTPYHPPNPTNPSPPLPISLRPTWHSYPHQPTTIELAPPTRNTSKPEPRPKRANGPTYIPQWGHRPHPPPPKWGEYLPPNPLNRILYSPKTLPTWRDTCTLTAMLLTTYGQKTHLGGEGGYPHRTLFAAGISNPQAEPREAPRRPRRTPRRTCEDKTK